MVQKKHNLIYQTTNLINNKVYIGRHSTNKLEDGYLGSGREFTKAIEEFGRDNFKREILFDFDNAEEMIAKEIEILTKEFVESDENYNLGIGQSGLFTHGEEARQKLREANTGFVTAKDKDGNTFRISTSDPRYLSGELVHILHGMIKVRDSDGNVFCVANDDPRWLNKELVSATTGTTRPKETVEKHIEFMKEYWSENKHSEQGIQKMRDVNVGKVTVIDNEGNKFRVSINDERYLSGELITACKGSIWIHNNELQKNKFLNPQKAQKYIDDGWDLGLVYFNKKKRVWITNYDLQISKQIEVGAKLESGWEFGRIAIPNIGEKISNGRTKGKWMNNGYENKIIHLNLIDEYLSEGWILGRIIKSK